MIKRLAFSMIAVAAIFITFTLTGFAQSTLSNLTIIDASVCREIQDREPVNAGDVFSSDVRKLYCFTRAAALEPAKIKHKWYYKDEILAELNLQIGPSPEWRTRSSKNIMPHQTGQWKVEIADEAGTVLKTIQFVVE